MPCSVMSNLIGSHYSLMIVKLGWNKITAKGASLIFEGVRDSRQLRLLDISWNNLSKGSPAQLTEMINFCGEAINISKLVHLDLSYNHLASEYCDSLGEMIFENHTLWGLHMNGNSCKVDAFGFIKKGISDRHDFMRKQISDGNTPATKTFSPTHSKANSMITNCWICEGWREIRVEFEIQIGT